MKASIEVKGQKIDFQRNWFTGNFTYTINGVERTLANVLNPATHFSFKLSKVYEVQIEDTTVTVLQTRPLFFAGFRAHNYKFYINKDLVKEIESL